MKRALAAEDFVASALAEVHHGGPRGTSSLCRNTSEQMARDMQQARCQHMDAAPWQPHTHVEIT